MARACSVMGGAAVPGVGNTLLVILDNEALDQ
jgi:hypothetical protein